MKERAALTSTSLGLIIYDHQRYNAYFHRTFFEQIGQFRKATQKCEKTADGGRITLNEQIKASIEVSSANWSSGPCFISIDLLNAC
jgi:hypothetical protein